jgi:hypothetical protein
MKPARTSFSEETEAKRLFESGAWALAASRQCPGVREVFWFLGGLAFFSKNNYLP